MERYFHFIDCFLFYPHRGQILFKLAIHKGTKTAFILPFDFSVRRKMKARMSFDFGCFHKDFAISVPPTETDYFDTSVKIELRCEINNFVAGQIDNIIDNFIESSSLNSNVITQNGQRYYFLTANASDFINDVDYLEAVWFNSERLISINETKDTKNYEYIDISGEKRNSIIMKEETIYALINHVLSAAKDCFNETYGLITPPEKINSTIIIC